MGEPIEITRHLRDALQHRFALRWQFDIDGANLVMRPRTPVQGVPQRRVASPSEIVQAMQQVLTQHGVHRPPLLPIRWGRDTDLLISAIQGLDPWLKDGADQVWREGFLPQPVVRFTGERDADGRLRDGFLTSFVNLSCVQRISCVDQHVELIDVWLTALSAAGIHAGRLRIAGRLQVWGRGPVSGVTLHMSCDGIGFADAVLLWHTADPRRLATDLGSGLERLRWLMSPRSWAETVFGTDAKHFDVDLLDAVRTGALLLLAGIRPGGHGAGAAVHRVARRIPVTLAASGLGRLVRTQRAYWAAIGVVGPPWPQVAEILEAEVLTRAAVHRR